MTSREYEDARRRELQAIIDNMRQACMDLIDEYYFAWRKAGRTAEEWAKISQFEHEWFKAFNDEHLTFEERRGALKVIHAYLKSQIETLQIEALYRKDGKRHAT